MGNIPVFTGGLYTEYGGIAGVDATSTVPSLLPDINDTNTGIGAAAADQLSLIAGGLETIRCTTTSVTLAGVLYVNNIGANSAYFWGIVPYAGTDTLSDTIALNAFRFNPGSLKNTKTGGQQNFVMLAPIYNQASGTAANADLLIYRTETALGSGQQSFLEMGTSALGILTRFKNDGVFFPRQAPTASAPTYTEGGLYYDTTLHKARIGGAAGWETITSA